MFAPYCHTCQSRILLGPRRIVHFFSPGEGALHVTVQCFCGTVLESDAAPPVEARGTVDQAVDQAVHQAADQAVPVGVACS